MSKKLDYRSYSFPISANASVEVNITGDIPLREAFEATIEYLRVFIDAQAQRGTVAAHDDEAVQT